MTIHYFRMVKATNLTFDQQKTPTWPNDWTKFQLRMFLIAKFWPSKFIQLDVCGRPLFANPVTNTDVYAQKPCRTILHVLHAIEYTLYIAITLILSYQSYIHNITGVHKKIQAFCALLTTHHNGCIITILRLMSQRVCM